MVHYEDNRRASECIMTIYFTYINICKGNSLISCSKLIILFLKISNFYIIQIIFIIVLACIISPFHYSRGIFRLFCQNALISLKEIIIKYLGNDIYEPVICRTILLFALSLNLLNLGFSQENYLVTGYNSIQPALNTHFCL